MKDFPYITERWTRKKLIDPKLKSWGWKEIIPFTDGIDTSAMHRCAVEEYPTDNGPADYALFIRGKLVGIVEAKKLSLGPQNVLIQAERYANETHLQAEGLLA